MSTIERFLPAISWLKSYTRANLKEDTIVSVVFTIMVIPQSLAYAMLAGLPAITGLYASILPSILYSLFGTSRTLAVGPVALTSVMTASIIAPFAVSGSEQYATIAILLALMSGAFLLVLSLLKLGFLSNLLSHPVISGFISATALIIVIGQLKYLLGIESQGDTLIPLIRSLYADLHNINTPTVILSIASIGSLLLARRYFGRLLLFIGLSQANAKLFSKAGPVVILVLATVAVATLSLDQAGIRVIGTIPDEIPSIQLDLVHMDMIKDLLPGTFLITIVGFIGSVSVAQSFAAKRRQDINPNQELVGLGLANIGSALSGAFPVTGGFSRTVLNVDCGAKNPMTGILTAVFILLILLFLTPLFFYLPIAILAAIISISMMQLINTEDLRLLWRFSKKEAVLLIVTFLVVLFEGMQAGLIVGVILSLLFFLWHTSHPHIAVVGRIPGTEHFRNVQRFDVETNPSILTVRIDENLFFANARSLEESLQSLVSKNTKIKHLILMCTAVNMVDASALQSLEKIDSRLKDSGVKLHLTEVKGPVIDKLADSDLIKNLSGKVFITQHQAITELEGEQANS
ncbi:sulfate permease [Marinomonas sp. C2222]|uniref:Sulfate permease n=1 Tax=Marinomonas sargassi TaxID=2984494 RepID=A0ABT2YV45_9GAMM|nr:sulfate permease [Marinomonas sargassi]MCV2403766.1 sulfate permease [Marinomonas sargassi]